MSSSLHTLARILTLHTETNWVQSHTPSRYWNNTLLSQGRVLGRTSTVGTVGKGGHSKDRGGSEKPLTTWVQFVGQP